ADMEDYGFEYFEEENEEQDVDIENQYYNSKGLVGSDPQEALAGFAEVVRMESDKAEWRFKALKQTVKLYYHLGKYKEMMDAYREMLTYFKSAVTRNYSEKFLNNIMDFVSGSASQTFELLQEFYQTTLRALEEAKNERIWFDMGEYGRMNKVSVPYDWHVAWLIQFLMWFNEVEELVFTDFSSSRHLRSFTNLVVGKMDETARRKALSSWRFDMKDPKIHFRELAQLKQEASVERYVVHFQKLAIMVLDISERRLIVLFMEGLTEPLRGLVKAFEHPSLQDAIKRSINLESTAGKNKNLQFGQHQYHLWGNKQVHVNPQEQLQMISKEQQLVGSKVGHKNGKETSMKLKQEMN
ncbi:hypothetical protein KI387_009652, partial [Taxus chinensis]